MQQQTDVWRLSASGDIPITFTQQPWPLRYAMNRAAESQQCNEPSQDCLHVTGDKDALAFAICDGVSLSFCGQVAAQLLAGRLSDWLYHACESGKMDQRQVVNKHDEHDRLLRHVVSWLDQLRSEGLQLVQAYELPSQMNPIVRDVLEEKRRHGSEAAFVAGVIQKYPESDECGLFLCWQGDIRIRLWIQDEEWMLRKRETMCTEERWSTNKGSIGNIHTSYYRWSVQEWKQAKLVIYSDGLALLDSFEQVPDPNQLAAAMSKALGLANSDDMTYLEISLSSLANEEVQRCP
ncbi:hypothetical protein [Paenibacillus sp. 481]|uniref:hypothetical protein n=1 Tax=Paenibacillus sp. 481 TaxID=2835869 RepID=UPI001E4FC3A9|nr:hypothetical protein [Paenibacillus sp. 481]UHA72077.1 hypothetical protein KIK04_15340 [Paenibacillus sp. 481]